MNTSITVLPRGQVIATLRKTIALHPELHLDTQVDTCSAYSPNGHLLDCIVVSPDKNSDFISKSLAAILFKSGYRFMFYDGRVVFCPMNISVKIDVETEIK